MQEVQKIQGERVEAARSPEERLEDVVALWSRDREAPVDAKAASDLLLHVENMVKDIELLSQSTPEQRATLEMTGKMAEDIEAEAQKREASEPGEWMVQLEAAKDVHELSERINDAEQVVRESVLETRDAPEQFSLRMRMDVARDALASYEALAGQVYELLKAGKNLPHELRVRIVEQGRNLLVSIKHEQQAVKLAEKNFINNIEANIAKAERNLAKGRAA